MLVTLTGSSPPDCRASMIASAYDQLREVMAFTYHGYIPIERVAHRRSARLFVGFGNRNEGFEVPVSCVILPCT
jgi:hypothetical protein